MLDLQQFGRTFQASQPANYAKITLINLKFPSLDENHPTLDPCQECQDASKTRCPAPYV